MDKIDELVEELRFKNLLEAVKTVNFSAEDVELIAEVIRVKTMNNVTKMLSEEPNLYEEVAKKTR